MAYLPLALTLAVLAAPQEPETQDPRLTSELTKSEKQKLNKAAKKWFDQWDRYNN